MAYLVVFRYFGCFWSSNRGKTEHEVRMPNDAFSKSTLSQPRSPARANHSIATSEKQAAQFHSIAKPDESPHQNHSITTLSPGSYLLILHSTRQAENKEEKRSGRNHSITPSWHPLDRTRSQGRWTIQSRLHCISLDRKTEPLKPSLINDILDHWEAHFSLSDPMTHSVAWSWHEDSSYI